MNLSKRLLSLLLLFTLSYGAPLLADNLSDKLAENKAALRILTPFKSVQVFQGEFEQHKKMPFFANAFISTGRFLSIRDRGLIWETQTPAPSTLVMTPGKVIQKTNGREQTFQASGTGYDGLGILLPAFLDGDLELLESYFEVSAQEQPTGWELTLIPRSKELKTLISEVKVLGNSSQLSEISMTGPNGDHTRIAFKSLSLSYEAPDAASLAAFKQP
ncbi:outer membrane lipoprotein carrier protein LolA [Endozoicomonas sp.]|uniref:outer membrane lipoprotein carrier protein LolA n=1 Tax=Endozoicomonas sp. TaxID=1892382 RepID=UPI002883EA0F|nr:outer membrane lipoprotein carrier protein LolA [Endozoicomonas sp.]